MAEQQSLEIPGYPHVNPVPNGCKIGNIFYSSSIFGIDTATGKRRETGEEQVEQCFTNLRVLLTEAGGSPKNVVFLQVFLTSAMGDAVNREWLKMFPDEKHRPARINLTQPESESNPIRLQCVAVLD